MGSLAGAATSYKITEVYKGELFYNIIVYSSIAKIRLTVRYIYQAVTKVGYSDPVIFQGQIIA